MFKWISYTEGASLLLLLFIAMPLKYIANMPEMVSIVGMAHGVLFVVYMAFVAAFFFSKQWSFKTSFFAGLASIIPFGPFVFEGRILKQHQPPAV